MGGGRPRLPGHADGLTANRAMLHANKVKEMCRSL